MTRQFRKVWVTAVFAACLVVAVNGTATAMDAPATSGKFRLQAYLSFGQGLEEIDLATTTDGDTVSISGGGGAGIGITAGYGLSSSVDIDLTFGYAETLMTPSVDNGDGSFDRTFILATLKYRIPVSNRFHIKLGGGAGYYLPGELDINLTNAGGWHDVVKYKNSVGAHAVAEFEFFFSKKLAINAGLKYYSVTYKEESGTRNGAPGYFTGSKVEKLDGSGVDFMLSLAKYF